MQHFTAGDKYLQFGARLQQFGEQRCCCDHLLKVIERQQEMPGAEVSFQEFDQRCASHVFQADGLGISGNHQVRIMNGSKRNKMDTISEMLDKFSCDLQSEAGFA